MLQASWEVDIYIKKILFCKVLAMLFLRSFSFACLLVLLTAAGCGGGGGGESSNPCGDLNVKIFGGDQCDFTRSPVVALVGFSAEGNPIGVCSATMVTTNDALTAAHCAEITSSPGGAGIFADGQLFRIVAGVNHP